MEAPWTAQHELELRRKAEIERNHWKTRCLKAESALRDLAAAAGDGAAVVKFMARDSSQYKDEVRVLRLKMARWDERNWAELCVSVLRGRRQLKHGDTNHTWEIAACKQFQPALNAIHAARDKSNREYLQLHAFRPEKMLLLKMAQRHSIRSMGWANSLLKFDHSKRNSRGARVRTMERMNFDSVVRAPELYNMKQMHDLIKADRLGSDGLSRHVEHEDRAGAEVRDVEATMLEVVDSACNSTCGGWATAGTLEDPHWFIVSMDGAGLAAAYSGVRVVLFAGSVKKMNQSLHGIHNIAEYSAGSHAEDHATLMARCSFLRGQLCRVYSKGYVSRRDGTKVYVKFMLSADKQGLFHLMGSRNMNWDAFSAQCDCCDKKGDITDLTKPPLTHFDHLTYEKRCARAHIPPHEAQELPEPDEWCVQCDVCGCLSKKYILQERADRLALDDTTASDEAHSRKHFGQNVGEDPVLPYNDSCSDILHMYLNVKKVSVATVFHHPFQIEKLNYVGDVKTLMSDLRDKLNARMDEDFDDKHFGGEGTFALHGDQVKTFMRGGKNGRLVPDLLAIIEPYFNLVASDGKIPAPVVAAAAPPVAAGSGARGRGRGRGGLCGRGRGAAAGRAGGAAPRAVGRGKRYADRAPRAVEAVESSDDEEDEDEEHGGAPTAAASPPVITYKAKVVVMFLAMSAHWKFTHSVNTRDASGIDKAERVELAKKAYSFGCDVVQAVVAVCGDEARQTYLHDMVYGLQKLFIILGKPYLGATEGNEHAHQEMKKDFHTMCCHSNCRAGSMLQLMELSHLRRVTFCKGAKFAPPTRQSEAALGMELGVRDSKRTKKNSDDAIAVQDVLLRGLLSHIDCEKEP